MSKTKRTKVSMTGHQKREERIIQSMPRPSRTRQDRKLIAYAWFSSKGDLIEETICFLRSNALDYGLYHHEEGDTLKRVEIKPVGKRLKVWA